MIVLSLMLLDYCRFGNPTYRLLYACLYSAPYKYCGISIRQDSVVSLYLFLHYVRNILLRITSCNIGCNIVLRSYD